MCEYTGKTGRGDISPQNSSCKEQTRTKWAEGSASGNSKPSNHCHCGLNAQICLYFAESVPAYIRHWDASTHGHRYFRYGTHTDSMVVSITEPHITPPPKKNLVGALPGDYGVATIGQLPQSNCQPHTFFFYCSLHTQIPAPSSFYFGSSMIALEKGEEETRMLVMSNAKLSTGAEFLSTRPFLGCQEPFQYAVVVANYYCL